MRFYDQLGGPETYNHYPIGWAMAFNTPYKLFKRYASHEGGIADTAIISWPNGIAAHGEVRDNYVNVCDITPDGLRPARHHPAGRRSRGIAAEAARRGEFQSGTGGFERRHRQGHAVLHDARHPRHLARGLVRQHRARRQPGRLVALRRRPLGALPHRVRPQPVPRPGRRAAREARGTQGAVVRRGRQVQRAAAGRPQHLRDAEPVPAVPVGRPQDVHLLPGHRGGGHRRGGRTPRPVLLGAGRGRPSTAAGAEGVLYKHGAGHGGHVLFVAGRSAAVRLQLHGRGRAAGVRRPTRFRWAATCSGVRYERTGTVEGSHTPLGDVSLYVDDDRRWRPWPECAPIPAASDWPAAASRSGRNGGQAVSSAYKAPFAFTGGTIAQVVVDVSGTPYVDVERELAAAFAKD